MSIKTVGIGLTICADFSADVGDKCPMEHKVDTSDFVAFTFGNGTESVELSFTAESLRAFLKLGTEALVEMDGLFASEKAAKADRGSITAAQRQEVTEATRGEVANAHQLATAGERGANA